MDLADFLSARVAEEETLAQLAIDGHGTGAYWDYDDIPIDGEHVTHWSPWRVMASCVAKRLVLASHRRIEVLQADGDGTTYACSMCRPDMNRSGWPCYTLRTLALEYADHVAYKYEWRPQRLRVLR